MTEEVTRSKMEQSKLDEMRKACLDNLYIFASVVCGFDKLTEHLHKDMCDFFQYKKALRKLVLVPRDHYKSSVAQAFVLWRLCRNPEERILIAGDTLTTAEKKLIKIRQLIENSPMLKILFPEIIPPDTSKVPWSTQQVTINRSGAHAEPSITAAGVSGARAGAHYTLIICDDIATKEAKDQPATMKKIIDWLDGTEALLEKPYEDEILVVGTPWSHDDVYEHIRKTWGVTTNEDFYDEFFRPFFDEEGEPIFPELYNGEANARDFAERMAKTNPYLWSSNFLLKPQIPDAEFSPEDLQYYTMTRDKQYVLLKPDSYDEPLVIPTKELDVFIAVDPAFSKDATASKAAINVSGLHSSGQIVVLESIGQRGGTDMLIERLCSLVTKYDDSLLKIGVERVGQQQSFIDYLSKEFRRRGIYRRVDPLPPGSRKSKEARIRSTLQPYFGERRVWVRVDMAGLLDEFNKFPLSQIRDELDAMAYSAQYYWAKYATGMNSNYEEYIKKYEEDRATASIVTGY